MLGSVSFTAYRQLFVRADTQDTPVVKQVKTVVSPQTSSLTWSRPPATQDTLLSLTNKERAKAGLSPLAANSLLDQSAKAKCLDMVTNNYWSHIDLSGQEPWRFIDATGYKKQAAGENLASGFTSNIAVVQGWMDSPAHRKTLLDSIYVDVGFGVCESPNFVNNGKQTIVVQHFGTPLP